MNDLDEEQSVNWSDKTVDYAVQNRVALITLNRPEALNAFVGDLFTDLKAAMAQAASDPGVRAIVLTGAGRAFCAGVDMKALAAGAPLEGDVARMESLEASFASDLGPEISANLKNAYRFGYFLRIKKPVIAAINGSAVGLGLAMALYADVRFSSEDAIFLTSFGQRGLTAEHGIAWLLSRLAGPSNALDLLFSSRRLSATEARDMGLVNTVVPQKDLLETALRYAQGIADSASPRSLAVMKAQVWHANFETFDASLGAAVEEMKLSLQQPDVKEGVSHFLERRAPRFNAI